VKHVVKPRCKHECRFLQVTPALWLCPHAAYGQASYLKGAVAEARTLLERAGGYDTVLARVVAEEEQRRQARREAQLHRQEDPPASEQVRYG
jgi:hypothetical protein